MNSKAIIAGFAGAVLSAAVLWLAPAQFAADGAAHAAERCLDYAEIGVEYPDEGCDSRGDLCSAYDALGEPLPLYNSWGCLLPVENKDRCFYRRYWGNSSYLSSSWGRLLHLSSVKMVGKCVNGKIHGKATLRVSSNRLAFIRYDILLPVVPKEHREKRYALTGTVIGTYDAGVENGDFVVKLDGIRHGYHGFDGVNFKTRELPLSFEQSGTYVNGYKHGLWEQSILSKDEEDSHSSTYNAGRLEKVVWDGDDEWGVKITCFVSTCTGAEVKPAPRCMGRECRQ